MSRLLVVLYLAAIVAANLSVAHWGPNAAIYNAPTKDAAVRQSRLVRGRR